MATFFFFKDTSNCNLLLLESEEFAADETCDTHSIEQTDKGYRCAIDVPSVLYK